VLPAVVVFVVVVVVVVFVVVVEVPGSAVPAMEGVVEDSVFGSVGEEGYRFQRWAWLPNPLSLPCPATGSFRWMKMNWRMSRSRRPTRLRFRWRWLSRSPTRPQDGRHDQCLKIHSRTMIVGF
jgi:hypothetical protein